MILFLKFTFSLDEFVFWANVNVKNNVISSQNLNISRSMISRSGGEFTYQCEIDSKKHDDMDILRYLNFHKDLLFDCFTNERVSVRSELLKTTTNVSNSIYLTLYPIYFTIDFKQNSVVIYKFQKRQK
ncbi:hypothetical protein LMG7974_00363 [Campylobacter majalis]|uniref:Flagellar-associated protein FlgQ n=2 Tax=Campylobacter majalis TaxID=2790656 RepID=A0ABM8Q3Y8_9BACT|nr:hypothetical protein LMG7974_00363 [Campylobacter majalis]